MESQELTEAKAQIELLEQKNKVLQNKIKELENTINSILWKSNNQSSELQKLRHMVRRWAGYFYHSQFT